MKLRLLTDLLQNLLSVKPLWHPPDQMTFCLVQMKFQNNDVIVREGSEGNTFYIILKGKVEKNRLVSSNVHSNQRSHGFPFHW